MTCPKCTTYKIVQNVLFFRLYRFFASWVVQGNIVTINRHKIVMNTKSGPLYLQTTDTTSVPLRDLLVTIRHSCISEDQWEDQKSGSCHDFKCQSQEGLGFKDVSPVLRYQTLCSGKDLITSAGNFDNARFVKDFLFI